MTWGLKASEGQAWGQNPTPVHSPCTQAWGFQSRRRGATAHPVSRAQPVTGIPGGHGHQGHGTHTPWIQTLALYLSQLSGLGQAQQLL